MYQELKKLSFDAWNWYNFIVSRKQKGDEGIERKNSQRNREVEKPFLNSFELTNLTAAVGFALTTYPIAVERKIITRGKAATRTLNTLP